MKLNILFTLLIGLNSFGQLDSTLLVKRDSLKLELIALNISHYSGYFGRLRSQGHILKDSLGNITSISMYCRSFDDSTIFYYQLKKYFPNLELSYDSIVDFRKKRTAKSTIYKFNEKGQKIFIRKIRAKIDPKRDDIPVRSETFWNGTENFYNNNGRKIFKRKISNEVF